MPDDGFVPIGTITPGVGKCWLVDICHEDGPVAEAWREAYTSKRRAMGDIRAAYGYYNVRFTSIANNSYLVSGKVGNA